MVIVTCTKCKKERKGVLPIYCNCGNVIGTEYKLVQPFVPTFNLPQYNDHAQICRTNECGHYNDGGCLLQIERMKKQGLNVAGSVSYLTHNPRVHCPMNSPMWYVGKIGFLSISYMQIGGTETFHQTLVPNLKGIAGFVAFDESLATGDFSLLKCQYGVGLKAAVRLANACKVLVVWGLGTGLDEVMKHVTNKPRIISISHCNAGNGWTKKYMLQQESHSSHFVYINPDGLGTVPMLRQGDATMLPNGINEKNLVTTRTREQIRTELGIPLDAKVGIMLTRLSPEKGVKEAMAAVRTTDHYLLVYGNASYWNKGYKRELKTLQNSRVKLMNVARAANVLPVADYYLSCSQYEGFGLSMAEAMYMGIPVVSTVTGIASTHPKAFTLLPLNPYKEQIISAINNLRDTTVLAKQVVLDNYTSKHFVNNWQRFLDEQALLSTL